VFCPHPGKIVLDEDDQETDDKGEKYGYQNHDRPLGAAFKNGRGCHLQNLQRRRVFHLSDPRLLILLCQEFENGFLNLDLAVKPGKLQTQVGHLLQREQEFIHADTATGFASAALFHLPQYLVDLLNAVLQFNHRRMRGAHIFVHHTQLNSQRGQFGHQLRGALDRNPGLFWQGKGIVLLLKGFKS